VRFSPAQLALLIKDKNISVFVWYDCFHLHVASDVSRLHCLSLFVRVKSYLFVEKVATILQNQSSEETNSKIQTLLLWYESVPNVVVGGNGFSGGLF
jgi:hypothetical protein